MRGFVFGLGAFVRATTMSKSVNRMGAFHGLSVGLTLAGAAAGALVRRRARPLARGRAGRAVDRRRAGPPGNRFLLMATTLKRMPLGIKPFGPPREGLKTLDVDAQPKRLLKAMVTVLSGGDAPWLAKRGYRRGDAKSSAHPDLRRLRAGRRGL
jgi:diacylglycerol kinase (ATP)